MTISLLCGSLRNIPLLHLRVRYRETMIVWPVLCRFAGPLQVGKSGRRIAPLGDDKRWGT